MRNDGVWISRLTKKQISLLRGCIGKWDGVALLTNPPIKQKVENAVKNIYINPFNKKIVWCQSPFEALKNISRYCSNEVPIAYSILSKTFKNKLEINIYDYIYYQALEKIHQIVFDENDAFIVHNVINRTIEQLSMNHFDHIIVGNMAGSIYKDVRWIAYYEYVQYLTNIKLDSLYSYLEISKNCSFWWVYGKYIFLVEKPIAYRRDDEGRLHAEGRPAIEFSDGWGVYEHHGVQISPEWGSLPHSQWEARWLLQNRNAEQKRALIDVLGYENIMSKVGSKIIHSEVNMELRRIDCSDDEPLCVLKVKCPSTGGIYSLRVPPDIESCESARQWTFGDEPLSFITET